MAAKPLIVGLGKGTCGDDALGPVLAAKLARTFGDAVQVAYHAGPLWDLAASGPRNGLVVIIDAAEASAEFPVGSWRRLLYPRDSKLLAATPLHDTHTLSIEALLRLGQALGRRHPPIWIYAVAGERFQLGDMPSLGVLRAAAVLARRIEADIRRWLGLEPYPAKEITNAHDNVEEAHAP